jgi:hypothetical protein
MKTLLLRSKEIFSNKNQLPVSQYQNLIYRLPPSQLSYENFTSVDSPNHHQAPFLDVGTSQEKDSWFIEALACPKL